MDDSHYLPPHQVDSTSTRLIRRVGERDGDAWRQLVAVYGPVVRYWIRRAGLAGSDLADVFQEVFIAVSRSIGNFEREDGGAKFRAWLKTVTVSKVNDYFRHQGKHPVAYGGSTAMMRFVEVEAESTFGGDDDAALDQSEDAFLTQRILQLVKGEFRDKTWLSFYRTSVDGRTSQEVAEELGISALAVRKNKSRVMQRLKEALGNTDPSR